MIRKICTTIIKICPLSTPGFITTCSIWWAPNNLAGSKANLTKELNFKKKQTYFYRIFIPLRSIFSPFGPKPILFALLKKIETLRITFITVITLTSIICNNVNKVLLLLNHYHCLYIFVFICFTLPSLLLIDIGTLN